MKIVFVHSVHNSTHPTKPLGGQIEIPFGISYLCSYLQKEGYSPHIMVLNSSNKGYLKRYLETYSPRLVGFSPVATEYPFVAEVAREIKKGHPEILLMAGGPHVSLNPEPCLEDAFDALCLGEGEEPMAELVQQLAGGVSPKGIANLWLKQEGYVEKNPPRPFLADLDRLPFPEREGWQPWILQPISKVSVLLGRGCPFNCTYCCNHALRKLASGAYVRLRSTDSVLKEIEQISRKFPEIKNIYLEVETFGVDLGWVQEFCTRLAEFNAQLKEKITFGTNLRITPQVQSDDFFRELARGNIKYVQIGLESGSERVRRQILKRFESNQDIVNTVKLARKHGIAIHFYNMIGIPGETWEDFQETLKINRACLPDGLAASIFYPYPGTELYARCQEQGLLTKALNVDLERERAILDLPEFPLKKIQEGYLWFEFYIYRGVKPMPLLLMDVLERWLHLVFPVHRSQIQTIFRQLRAWGSAMKRVTQKVAKKRGDRWLTSPTHE